jgi:hypothetical protein
MSRLLLLLLMLHSPASAASRRAGRQKRHGGGRIEGGVVRTDELGTEVWEAPGALSREECESIRAAGADRAVMEGSGLLQNFAGSSDRQSVPTEVRSTKLQWLGSGRPEVDLLREELFAAAKRAAREAGWTGRLRHLQNLQVGAYDAAAGGHYTWHSDQDWSGAVGGAQPRLLTVVVQLSVPDGYRGGQLQVGLVNASEAQVRKDAH